MPRKPKPPAIPVEITTTEEDFDILTSAIEAHMKQSERIGTLYGKKELTDRQALHQAADADEKLYNINDAILLRRALARQEQIEKESDGSE